MRDNLSPLILALAALITGAFMGAAALSIGIILEWSRPWVIGGGAFALGGALAWLLLLRFWVGIAHAAHGITTQPVQTARAEPYNLETVRFSMVEELPGGYLNGNYITFPVNRDELRAVCRQLEAGATFSHASLAGPGKILSRSQFEVLRDAFLQAGVCRWMNPGAHNQGLTLTPAGKALIRYYSDTRGSPPPQEVDANTTDW